MDIRLDTIVGIATFLGTGIGGIIAIRVTIARLSERQTALSERQTALETVLKSVVLQNSANMSKIATALTRMARYDERIRYLRRDVEEIRRREGLIRHPLALPEPDEDDESGNSDGNYNDSEGT